MHDDLATVLAPRFSLAPGRSGTLRRTWLDTFDWRLHRAGLTLEQSSGRRSTETVLTDRDGSTVAGHSGPLRWPALATDLPEGALRSALEPVTGLRAVAPVVRTASEQRILRVCNTDDKTVAWLTVERMTVRDGGTHPAAVLVTVTAVRGYRADADRVAQCLAGAPVLARPAPAPLDVALAAIGRHAQDYTGGINVELSPGMPARRAVADVLLRLLEMLEANVPGTLHDVDTEFLHDLRVAVRRTRAALKLVGDVLPRGLAGQYRPEFKWLGDATTPTRDLDVYLLNYGAMAARLVAATPGELEPLHDYLIGQRATQWRTLARVLRSARFADLTASWRAALTTVPAGSRGPATGRLATDRIERALRRVLVAGAAITDGSPPEALHDLRKRCKELRYAVEFFASLHDPLAHRQLLAHLKGLQDCLGEFQDSQVQRQELRMFAGLMLERGQAPASALLAMGELAGQLALRQRRARKEFAGRFATFAGPQIHQHVRALTKSTPP